MQNATAVCRSCSTLRNLVVSARKTSCLRREHTLTALGQRKNVRRSRKSNEPVQRQFPGSALIKTPSAKSCIFSGGKAQNGQKATDEGSMRNVADCSMQMPSPSVSPLDNGCRTRREGKKAERQQALIRFPMVNPPVLVHPAVPPAVGVRAQNGLGQFAGQRRAQPLERAVQPFPGKGVAFAQFHMQIADQIQLIRVVGQLGFPSASSSRKPRISSAKPVPCVASSRASRARHWL